MIALHDDGRHSVQGVAVASLLQGSIGCKDEMICFLYAVSTSSVTLNITPRSQANTQASVVMSQVLSWC